MTAPRRDLLLDVQGLAKGFTLHGRGGLRLPVLDGLDLQLSRGECLALVGASGNGKSTLIKCLYGSYAADAGQIWLHEQDHALDLAQATPQQWLALRRRRIAYVSQFLQVVPRVSALDVVADRVIQAHPAPVDDASDSQHEAAWQDARARAGRLLQRLNLPPELWGLPPATFSGGEQQRVNIARGLIEPARLLLLDEPTASLDAVNRQVVVALIRKAMATGSAVVGIFHDEEVRRAVATRCLTLERAHAG